MEDDELETNELETDEEESNYEKGFSKWVFVVVIFLIRWWGLYRGVNKIGRWGVS